MAGDAPRTGSAPLSGARPVDPLALPHTDWLRHGLVVTGPAEDVAALQAAAAGTGAIPWAYPDLDLQEEDRVMALVQPPDGSAGLSLAGSRALARALRDAVEAHQHRVVTAVGRDRSCPFDLHALLPVPDPLLRRGPDDPASLAWLRWHWGVVHALRHVRMMPGTGDRRLRRSARIAIEFWSADWTPWAAFQALRQRWPSLIFDVRPDYGA